MGLGDGLLEITQGRGRFGAARHDDFDRRANYVGLPALAKPTLHAVRRGDAARIVFFETLQSHQVVTEGKGFRRDQRF
jgi:hypothetical protein